MKMEWCDESQCQAYPQLPEPWRQRDKHSSWMTQAELPKRAPFDSFKDMPENFDGILKLLWQNTVRRMMRQDVARKSLWEKLALERIEQVREYQQTLHNKKRKAARAWRNMKKRRKA